MVKRRETTEVSKSIEKRIEQFADAADQIITKESQIDVDAIRDYKAIRVPFNKYEYELLERLCKKTDRSKLNMIRHALKYYDENVD